MDQAKQQIIDGLKQAILAEGDGYHFYTMAAANTHDEQGQETLKTLALEELDHLRFLKGQYQAFLETGAPDQTLKLGPRAELAKTSPIFSPALRQRINEAHQEMSALSIGIQLELSAQQFYEQQARRAAGQPQVQAFFTELSAWEAGHYQALLRQQDELRDDYWSAGGFSPF